MFFGISDYGAFVAAIVVFLASDESQFTTGQAYSVDGGMTI